MVGDGGVDDSGAAFANAQIAPGDLPDYRETTFAAVAPAFRRYTLISSGVGGLALLSVPLILAAGPAVADPTPGLVAGAIVLLTALVALQRWIDAGFRGWALRDHDLVARYGILWRCVVVLPIARIQHAETTSGPLERLHGLARLRLYTAGGNTADLTLIGLTGAVADRLRAHLVEQIRLRESVPDSGSPPEAGPEDVDAGGHGRD